MFRVVEMLPCPKIKSLCDDHRRFGSAARRWTDRKLARAAELIFSESSLGFSNRLAQTHFADLSAEAP